jgi:hypothetical protein
MTLDALFEYAKTHGSFNDIWFYAQDKTRKPFETEPVTTLLGKEVPGILAFGRHGSASLYAQWQGHIVWLDSEGDQFVIARNVDHFIDALLFEIGAVWQVANACQETASFVEKFRGGRHKQRDALVSGFDAAYFEAAKKPAQEWMVDNVAEFAAWAAAHGRAAPTDLVDRLIELRAAAEELRRHCE